MSKLAKTILIGFIIVVIGVILIIVALGLSNWSLGGDYEVCEYICDTQVDTLDFDIGVGNVNVSYYDGEYVKVIYEQNKRLKTSFSISKASQNSQCALQIKNKAKFRIFSFGNVFEKAPNMTISLPQSVNFNLQGEINAGVANIDSGNFGKVSTILNAGTLNFEDINCGYFYCKVNAGEAKVQNLITGNAAFDVNAGNIKLAEIVTGKFESHINAGSFYVKDLTSGNSLVKINAGSCNIEKFTSGLIDVTINAGGATMSSVSCDKINFKVNSGKLTANMLGNLEDYTIRVRKNSGKCSVKSQTGTDPEKVMELEIDSGSIYINF